jgi:putative transposase
MIFILRIPNSTVFYKKKSYPKRKSPQRKVVSEELKIAIFEITKKKATYGVPRVLAILNRDYDIQETKYLVHKFMREEGLLIKNNRSRGSNRPHTGTISVKETNTRWASDITSIKCWNGQKLRVEIVIDCCDRSIISWKAGL